MWSLNRAAGDAAINNISIKLAIISSSQHAANASYDLGWVWRASSAIISLSAKSRIKHKGNYNNVLLEINLNRKMKLLGNVLEQYDAPRIAVSVSRVASSNGTTMNLRDGVNAQQEGSTTNALSTAAGSNAGSAAPSKVASSMALSCVTHTASLTVLW